MPWPPLAEALAGPRQRSSPHVLHAGASPPRALERLAGRAPAISRASVVLPVPGGPQRITETAGRPRRGSAAASRARAGGPGRRCRRAAAAAAGPPAAPAAGAVRRPPEANRSSAMSTAEANAPVRRATGPHESAPTSDNDTGMPPVHGCRSSGPGSWCPSSSSCTRRATSAPPLEPMATRSSRLPADLDVTASPSVIGPGPGRSVAVRWRPVPATVGCRPEVPFTADDRRHRPPPVEHRDGSGGRRPASRPRWHQALDGSAHRSAPAAGVADALIGHPHARVTWCRSCSTGCPAAASPSRRPAMPPRRWVRPWPTRSNGWATSLRPVSDHEVLATRGTTGLRLTHSPAGRRRPPLRAPHRPRGQRRSWRSPCSEPVRPSAGRIRRPSSASCAVGRSATAPRSGGRRPTGSWGRR